jgi:hypothetical protein
MAKPRVFISSTFYDLRQVREDIERTIRELGYEPVRNESGTIPYPKEEALETSAYREIELCDIIVAIIGGRFGTESNDQPGYSISQVELKRALDRGIQVFIFIERSVLGEFSTYQLNKSNRDTAYRFVDDVRIYEFIDEVHKLPRNNPIAGFEIAADITEYLRTQWAGMFQRFLQEQKRLSEMRVLEEMNSIAKTLRELVTFLTEERRNKDEAIKSILLVNNPVFSRLARLTQTDYRVFFSNRGEMEAWLNARGFKHVSPDKADPDSVDEWFLKRLGSLRFTTNIFDDNGRLKAFDASEWQDDWITLIKPSPPTPPKGLELTDDDIPF